MLYTDMDEGQEAKRRMEISNRKLEEQRGRAGSPEPRWWEPDHGGRVWRVNAEARAEICLGRKTVASCLLPESSTSASPRSKAPKASWQGNLANEFPAEQRAGRVGNGPDSKQANDWQRLPACLWKSPEMQHLPAHLVIQTVYVQKESKSI